MQSSLPPYITHPFHAGIIMDGNGRWAVQRGLSRGDGHRQGVKTVRTIAEFAPSIGINTMTLYAFSSDNWKRPKTEVNQLMELLYDYLHSEKEKCLANGIRLSVIGRRDRLSLPLRTAIKIAETATRHGSVLHLRIAIDYSSRDAILRAIAYSNRRGAISRQEFSSMLGKANHLDTGAPDVDILIRTGGEKRLSDFLLWECAYAELFFTDRMWPEFTPADLEEIVHHFNQRERRFGKIPA